MSKLLDKMNAPRCTYTIIPEIDKKCNELARWSVAYHPLNHSEIKAFLDRCKAHLGATIRVLTVESSYETGVFDGIDRIEQG